jgi:Cu(I)/Ag(I) efflux system periplasmic protein CusF
MLKGIGSTLLICLLAATSAQGQSPGDHGHEGHAAAPIAVDQVDIVGVVQAIDPAAGRVTIAYEAVEARNWPPGTMSFVVNNPSLLSGVTVGEKVRFKLESEQITELAPFVSRSGGGASQAAAPSVLNGF